MEFFTKKNISVKLTLEEGSFDGSANQIEINNNIQKGQDGFGIELNMVKNEENSLGFNKCSVKIYNLPLSIMEQATTLIFDHKTPNAKYGKHEITVSVGDVGDTLTPIFTGQIVTAVADFNASPDTVFTITANTGAYLSIIMDDSITYKKGTALDSILSQLASKMKLSYVNEGVTGSIQSDQNCVRGSAYEKLCYLASAHAFYFVIDDNTLNVFPSDRKLGDTQDAPVINSENGLIGYPTFSDKGVRFRCLYDPRIRFNTPVKVESIVPRATGVWRIIRVTTRLSAFVNHPVWECMVDTIPYGA